MNTLDRSIEKFRDEVSSSGGPERFAKAFTNIWMDRAQRIISDGDVVGEAVSEELYLLRIMIEVLSVDPPNKS